MPIVLTAWPIGSECTANFTLVHVLAYAPIVLQDQVTVRHVDMEPHGALKLWMHLVIPELQIVRVWMDIPQMRRQKTRPSVVGTIHQLLEMYVPPLQLVMNASTYVKAVLRSI